MPNLRYLVLFCVLMPLGIKTQNTFEEFKKKLEGDYASFRDTRNKEFEDFRNKINEEYALLLKKTWKEFNAFKGILVPDEDKHRFILRSCNENEIATIYCMQVTMRYMIRIIGKLTEKNFIHWIVIKNNCVYVRSLVYEYDDKVWGGDRAFFADETLYYPYCDCEDQSILFSRLVRDLLGLEVVLVYYPGHLATAVQFTENITGDYVAMNGKRYVICDPTYIGAPVGATMPEMDNAKAKIILLE